MKKVTYKGRADGVERPGVRAEGMEFLVDQPVVVSEAVAAKIEKLEDYKFSITDAPEGHVPEEEQSPLLGSAGGFGGSQGSVEVEPDQESS